MSGTTGRAAALIITESYSPEILFSSITPTYSTTHYSVSEEKGNTDQMPYLSDRWSLKINNTVRVVEL